MGVELGVSRREWIIALSMALLLLLLVLCLSGCGLASQTKQVKGHYKYTTSCEWTILGAEAQVGNHVAVDMEAKGADCLLGRDSNADSEDRK